MSRFLLLIALLIFSVLPIAAQEATSEPSPSDQQIIDFFNEDIDRTIAGCEDFYITNVLEISQPETIARLQNCGVTFSPLGISAGPESGEETPESIAVGKAVLEQIANGEYGAQRLTMSELPEGRCPDSLDVYIVEEGNIFRCIYVEYIENLPDFTEWAQCALDWLEANENGRQVEPLIFSVGLNSDETPLGYWTCEIHFIVSGGAAVEVDLANSALGAVYIQTLDTSVETIIAAFAKETLSTAYNLRYLHLEGPYMRDVLIRYDSSVPYNPYLGTELLVLLDGLSVTTLHPLHRVALNVPDYVPYGHNQGVASVLTHIYCLSQEGRIRRSNLDSLLDIYDTSVLCL